MADMVFFIFLVIMGLIVKILIRRRPNKTVHPFSYHSECDISDDDGNGI